MECVSVYNFENGSQGQCEKKNASVLTYCTNDPARFRSKNAKPLLSKSRVENGQFYRRGGEGGWKINFTNRFEMMIRDSSFTSSGAAVFTHKLIKIETRQQGGPKTNENINNFRLYTVKRPFSVDPVSRV